jgi:Primosomal protein N'' (replication factor Y) - superfamily II helicase
MPCNMPRLANIIFPLAIPRTLTYLVTEGQLDLIKQGSFVWAPIGKKDQLGLVQSLSDVETPDNEGALPFKRISCTVQDLLPIAPSRISFWQRVASYYLCSLGEVMKAALPLAAREALRKNQAPATQLSTPSRSSVPSLPLLLKSPLRTEAYTALIQEQRSLGKSVLLLVPEMGQAQQCYQEYLPLFGSHLLLLHSELSPARHRRCLQAWTQQEDAYVLIGTRSALLQLDLSPVGMIIVDEEQDPSYKQTDPSPRFHARDLALLAGQHYQIQIVLGSACPSLETEYNLRSGKYQNLPTEDAPPTLPPFEIIDTQRLEKRKQMCGMLSRPLLEALQESLKQERQCLLFTRDCTQLCLHLEEYLPEAGLARLDAQRSPKALQDTLRLFEAGDIDILVSTQTLYKGLQFKNIGCIGILEADKQLSRQDFRSHERAYQTFRLLVSHPDAPELSRIILQTAHPDQSFYHHLGQQNQEAFILEQLQERRDFHYPPFVRLVALRIKHPNPQKALEAAQALAQDLPALGITQYSGPFAPYQAPDSRLYTQMIWLQFPRTTAVESTKQRLYEKVLKTKIPGGYIQIDVDPY